MGKIKYALLVDDSDATNFFNKRMIQKTDCVEEILIAKNGKEAIDYIESGIIPEIIFLDINMPIMNGWEFIAEYQKLSEINKNSVIVLMIGAALSENERKLAESIPEIKEFREKILTVEVVCEMMVKYFDHVTSEVCS